MKKRTTYPISVKRAVSIFLLSLIYTLLWAQQEVRVVPGAHGNYVYCGQAIPKGFVYVVERSPANREQWQVVGKTAFVADSSLFFNKLIAAASLNRAYQLPDTHTWPYIWWQVGRAAILDSVYYHGTFPSFQEALGTVFYDTTARREMEYLYRVGRLDGREVMPASFTASNTGNPRGSTLHTVYAEPNESHVRIRYYSMANPQPAGLRLYRETYMQTGFREMAARSYSFEENGRPYFLLTDSLAEPGVVYRYYALPYDLWGNAGMPSDTIRMANKVADDVPQIFSLTAMGDTASRAIRISWQTTDSSLVESVSIYRSQFYESEDYVYIGSTGKQDSAYYDRDVAPARAYYYSIVLHGSKGNGSPSVRVSGLLPAMKSVLTLAPVELEAADNGNGQVELQWVRPNNDVKGYYVYRDLGDGKGPVQCSGLVRSLNQLVRYTDTLPGNPAGQVWYAVRTLSLSDNLSIPSDTVGVYLTANDLQNALPARPTVMWNGQVALLHWGVSSASGRSPFMGFVVCRQESNGEAYGEFVAISPELPAFQTYWEDSTYVRGKVYRYKVQGLLRDGVSKDSEPTTHHLEAPRLYAPAGLMVRTEGREVILSWDTSVQEEVFEYRVLRHNGLADHDPETLKTLGSEATSFVDEVRDSGYYYYTVISVGRNGAVSPVENWVGVEIE